MTSLWNGYGSLPGRIRQMPLHETDHLKAGMPHYRSFSRLRPMPSRSWIYSLNHSQQLSVRQKNKYVNSNPPAPSVRKRIRPVGNTGPQMICVGEDNSVHKGESVEARGAADCALPLCWLRHEPVSVVPSGFRTPPGLALPIGS